MTDRELLELAAKAAEMGGVPGSTGIHHDNGTWNPLTDDGDALRLAVKLKLEISIGARSRDPETKELFEITIVTGDDGWATEHHSIDPYAATRRAIVRAAAEIGKTK